MRLTPFIYDSYVTGRDFAGRKSDVVAVTNILAGGDNLVLYAPPKTGKMSLVQQTFLQMRMMGRQFSVCEVKMTGLRTLQSFLIAYGEAVMRIFANTPFEYDVMMARYFDGTHFVFDKAAYAASDAIFSLSWDIDEEDMRAMLRFPFRAAQDKSRTLYLMLEEFQDVEFIEEEYRLLKVFEEEVTSFRRNNPQACCSLVFIGSRLNAMKELFEKRGIFHRVVTRHTLSTLTEKEIVAHMNKALLTGGKVIEPEMLSGVCQRFKYNIWYIEQFISICDHLTRGFVNEPVLMEALGMLIASYEDRFESIMYDLTNHQVSLLRAIVDGYTRLSSAEVIAKYSLNSSANVKRVREALMKKEVITMDENDEPVIIDPLFEFWVRKYFFRISADN